jgi:hypothetical protein
MFRHQPFTRSPRFKPNAYPETIEEMTARTLDGLPRSQAIETMIKFNEMKLVGGVVVSSRVQQRFVPTLITDTLPLHVDRDQLKLFLEGFRGGDKVVKEEDIRSFIDGMKEQAEARR